MFTWDGMELTIWPENLWSAFRWYHLFFVTGAYGLITHWKSLPGVYRYMGSDEYKPKSNAMSISLALILMLFLRMTLVLPCRVILFVAGIVWVLISIPAFGKIPICSNPAFQEAWTWYESAESLYE